MSVTTPPSRVTSLSPPGSGAGTRLTARPSAGTGHRPAVQRRLGGRRLRHIEGLFDLNLPAGGSAGRVFADPIDGARALARQVREAGGPRCDIRVLADAGDQLPLLRALAGELDRDVLGCPPGAEIHYVLGFGPDGNDVEAIPVDRVTGYPVDWLLVQPARWTCAGPGWYDLGDGIICPRTGPVTLPLPGGLSLATREDYLPRRAEAARLGSGHSGLTTVAAVLDRGDFVIGDYSGAASVQRGRGLAAVLAALPLYGGDVRLWLRWPPSIAEQARLEENLHELADTTGAVVWVPPRGGRSEVREPHDDLVALDPAGTPDAWFAFPPDGHRATPRFTADLDGRLVPAGGITSSSWPGVGLVSVPGPRARRMLATYRELSRRDGLFAMDLAVLADGRAAARHEDGSVLALGPRTLSHLLRQEGWRGEDLVLLTPVGTHQSARLRRWAEQMALGLGSGVFTADPGAAVVVDGGPRLLHPDGREATWHRAGPATAAPSWASANGRLVPTGRTDRTIEATPVSPSRPPAVRAPAVAAPAVAAPAAAGEDLGQAMFGIAHALPELQRSYRVALRGLPRDQADGLVDAWYAYHDRVVAAGCAPSLRAIRSGRWPGEEDRAEAARLAAEVTAAHELLRERLAPADKTKRSGASTQDISRLFERWSRLLRGKAQLRGMVHTVLSSLDADDDSLHHLAQFTAAAAEYATLEQAVQEVWADPGHAQRRTELVEMLAYLEELRDALELAAVGVGEVEVQAEVQAEVQVEVEAEVQVEVEAEVRTPAPLHIGRPTPPDRDVTATIRPVDLARPRFVPAAAKKRPHGLYWLPEEIEVNADAIDVYVPAPWTAQRCVSEGVPSAELFLVGQFGPGPVAGHRPHSCLLRVRVEPGGAVALSAGALHGTADEALPASPEQCVVIPAGWLDRARIVGSSTVDASGRLAGEDAVPPAAVRLCSVGAAHGADGVPNDVQFWPHRRPRASSRVYAVLPASGASQPDGWIELFEHRPSPAPGERLIALRIAQGQAIDVTASAARLKKLPLLQTKLGEMRASGIRLILPQRSFDRVGVADVFLSDAGSWRREPTEAELTLGALLADGDD